MYVEEPDANKPTFEGREIVLGPRAGDYYIVRRGLHEGERVVTQGNFKIDTALQIQAKPSMMTPDGGGGPVVQSPAGPGQKDEGPRLPAMFVQQLSDVLAAAGNAQQAAAGRRCRQGAGRVRGAGQAIAAVDANAVLERQAPNGLVGPGDASGQRRVRRPNREDNLRRQTTPPRRLAENAAIAGEPVRVCTAEAPSAGRPRRFPPAFRKQLDAVVAGYFAAVKALADDDAAKARRRAQGTWPPPSARWT